MIDNQQNFFQVFGLPETFAVDSQQLTRRYHELLAQFHPDRFAGADENTRLRAVQAASLINQAHATLVAPLTRAAYLLSLKGEDVENVSQAVLGPELLLEQMALREALEDLPADASALEQLASLKTEVTDKLAQRQSGFARELENDALLEARKIFHEMQFLSKLLTEIERGEEQRLGY